MIYIAEAVSAVIMLTAALLFTGIINGLNIIKKRFICSIGICMCCSIVIASCYIQENRIFDVLAFSLYPLRYYFIIRITYSSFKWRYFYTIILYEFIVNIFVSSITNIFENTPSIISQFIPSIITATINLLILVLLYRLKERISYNSKRIINLIPHHIYLLVLLAVLCLCALSTLNNYSTESFSSKEIIMNLIIIVFTFIIGYIIISLLVNVISKQHYSNITAMLNNQVEIQIRHYDKLDKLNREMNSFRHDYTNHLHSIYSLIKMKENTEALEYIEKLFEAKHKPSTIFNTGNKLADAILTDKADVLLENTSIDYEGIIPSSIDNIDLCTILSNALDNAIEACRELTDSGAITISAQERQGYFVLTITNPTKHANFENIPTTTKTDKEHHGIGLLNIQDVVRKHDGQMKTHCENGVFELSVAIKI